MFKTNSVRQKVWLFKYIHRSTASESCSTGRQLLDSLHWICSSKAVSELRDLTPKSPLNFFEDYEKFLWVGFFSPLRVFASHEVMQYIFPSVARVNFCGVLRGPQQKCCSSVRCSLAGGESCVGLQTAACSIASVERALPCARALGAMGQSRAAGM